MDDSYSLCENLGGHFPIPRGVQQYQNIFSKNFPKGKFINKKIKKKHLTVFGWLEAVKMDVNTISYIVDC